MTTFNFEKDERVKEISLDDLSQTLSLAMYNKKLPSSRPLNHYEFINKIGNILTKQNIAFQIDPIWVSKSDSNIVPALDPNKEGNLNAWLYQRLVTRLHINDGNSENNGSIAISYNKDGLAVAFGLNVSACQNMSIFGENLVSTYRKGVPYDKLLEVVTKWIYELPQLTEENRQIFDKLKNYEIKSGMVKKMVGELHCRAVASAYLDNEVIAPLNISQMSQFTKSILQEQATVDKLGSMYEIYNFGTSILSPKNTDLVSIWHDNRNFGNFVLDIVEGREYEYNRKYEEAKVITDF